MKQLRLTVPLGPNETPASYASRLALRNGLSAREFALDFGATFQSVVDGDPAAINVIAGLGGVSPAAVAANAFVRGDGHSYKHRGEILMRYGLRRSRIHVCGECLIENARQYPALPFHLAACGRAEWVLDCIRTCAKHGVPLIEIVNDLDPSHLHDFAHHVLAAKPRLAAMIKSAPRREVTAMEQYVLGRFDQVRECPFLDGLELHVAIRTCEMIGAVDLFGRRANIKGMGDPDWLEAGARGFEIAAGGTDAICGFLDRLQDTYLYTRAGTQGPQAIFGRLYQWLEFGAKDPAYDPVRTVVGDHIRRHQPVGVGDLVFGNPVAERTLHSIRTLALESHLHPKRLRKTLRAAGIIDETQMALPDQRVVFGAQRASNVIRKAKGAVELSGAGKYLNAPRVHIRLLAESRFIEPYVPAAGFGADARYAIEDLDEFLNRLFQNAETVVSPPAGSASVPAAAKRACCSATKIVRMILDRELNWTGKVAGLAGYLSVLVSLDEIRTKVRGPDHGGLSLREVGTRLRTSDRVVADLVATGRLKTFTAVNPVNRCLQVLVAPDELARFQAQYVSLFMLSVETGRHFRLLKNDLDRQGIGPALGADPRNGAKRQIGAFFYSRRSVEHLRR